MREARSIWEIIEAYQTTYEADDNTMVCVMAEFIDEQGLKKEFQKYLESRFAELEQE